MPACDVKIDVYCQETPPVPPTPTVYHTVLFNVAKGETLIGSGYSVVEEGEYFGWINKPTATKEGETFVCWTDKEGNKISNIHQITENMSVYASFIKETDKVYSYDETLGYFEIVDASSSTENIEVIIETEEQSNTVQKHVNIPKAQFNFPVYFGSKITEVKDGFLQGCTAFNQPIVIGSNITKIGKSFLKGCTAFDSSIEINDSVTEITSSENDDEGFMYGCTSFNQSLKIPNNLETIPNGFLSGCTKFNQPIIIPEATKNIGKWFLNNCSSFNQNLLLPSTIESVDEDFMFNCDSMVSVINFQFDPTDKFEVTENTLATENYSAACYQTGITIGGSYGEIFRGMCLESSVSPYRGINSFTTTCFVTFFSNGGGQILGEAVQTIESGTLFSLITPPKTRADTGFKFAGWQIYDNDEESTTYGKWIDIPILYIIKEDVVVRANFVEDTITVKFTSNDKGRLEGPTQQTTIKGRLFQDIAKPDIIPNDKCLFDGWYMNGFKLSPTDPITSSCTIEARFVNKIITVSVNTTKSGTQTRQFECNKDIVITLNCVAVTFMQLQIPVTFNIVSGGRTLTKPWDYTTNPDISPKGQPFKPVNFTATITIKAASFWDNVVISQQSTKPPLIQILSIA